MCRLVAYLGGEVVLADVLVRPVNSIVMQSLQARESSYPTNGDGFGLGWYASDISPEPALFTSISPAWSDRNLLHLTAKLKSSAFFAHVRAASAGGVTQFNCHPFVNGPWMLMHNGGIGDFMDVKRHLRHLLDDDIYNWVKGDTDSEHLFALFLQLAKNRDLSQLSVVADVFEETLGQVLQLVKRYGIEDDVSQFNVCLTDGKRLLASRYSSDSAISPETLHYAIGNRLLTTPVEQQSGMLLDEKGPVDCLLVASEKLTDFDAEWHDVPENQLLLVDEKLNITMRML